MSMVLRIILIVLSILTCIWVLQKIRHAQAKIEDSLFWLFGSFFLIVISIFPQIIEWGALLTGVASPVNFLFLSVLFVLLVKIFLLSIKLSQLENKFQALVQRYAIDQGTTPIVSTEKSADPTHVVGQS